MTDAVAISIRAVTKRYAAMEARVIGLELGEDATLITGDLVPAWKPHK